MLELYPRESEREYADLSELHAVHDDCWGAVQHLGSERIVTNDETNEVLDKLYVIGEVLEGLLPDGVIDSRVMMACDALRDAHTKAVATVELHYLTKREEGPKVIVSTMTPGLKAQLFDRFYVRG